MNTSRKMLVAGVAGLAMTLATLSAAALGGSARADAGHRDVVAERIAVAFANLPTLDADPAIQAAAARTHKGDLLVAAPCSGQKWPDIAPVCLVTADGTAVRPVRTITVGYQMGSAESVLIRMPAAQVAAR